MAAIVTTTLLSLAGANAQLVILPDTMFSLHLVVHTRIRELYQDGSEELHVFDDSGRTMDTTSYETRLPVTRLAEPGTMSQVLGEVLDDRVLGEQSLHQLASHLLDHVAGTRELRLRAELEVVIEVVVDDDDEEEDDVMERLEETSRFHSEGGELGTCSVCLEDLSGDLILTCCSHVYHESCIKSWVEMKKNSCPLCRRPL